MSRIPEFTYPATPHSCDNWIEAMHEAGLLYHLEDTPDDLGIFEHDECVELRQIVPVIFAVPDYDPFDKMVELTNQE